MSGFTAQAGEPAVVYWSPWITALGFLPWLLIVVLLCAQKSNWHPAAWTVWLPLVLSVGLAWLLLEGMSRVSGGGAGELYGLFRGMFLGSAGILLLPGLCACRVRGGRLTGMIVVMVAFVGMSVYASVGADMTRASLLWLMVVMPAGVAALSLRLALRACRMAWRPERLWGHLGGWSVGLWLVCMVFVALSQLPHMPLQAMLILPVTGLMVGGVMFGTLVPVLLLATRVPLYRERLAALAGLEAPPPMPAPPVAPVDGGAGVVGVAGVESAAPVAPAPPVDPPSDAPLPGAS